MRNYSRDWLSMEIEELIFDVAFEKNPYLKSCSTGFPACALDHGE